MLTGLRVLSSNGLEADDGQPDLSSGTVRLTADGDNLLMLHFLALMVVGSLWLWVDGYW